MKEKKLQENMSKQQSFITYKMRALRREIWKEQKNYLVMHVAEIWRN